MRDIHQIEDYQKWMSKERVVIPMLLELFEKHGIHATWATVGLLFSNTKEELLACMPSLKPSYTNPSLSPYPYIAAGKLGANEKSDPVHFGKSLIDMIRRSRHQRVSTHTFSHYYCLEKGQTREQFKEDIEAAMQIAGKQNIQIESIVFPRNQYNETYISLFPDYGISSYRGNPSHWLYKKGYSTQDSLIKRALRLLDAYLNVSGNHCYSIDQLHPESPVNLPASHSLRPYSKKFKIFEFLRLRRILSSMTYAAKHGLVYHLWWHPYNFANDVDENMDFLKKIIQHFKSLQTEHGMESRNMEELYEKVAGRRNHGKHEITRLR